LLAIAQKHPVPDHALLERMEDPPRTKYNYCERDGIGCAAVLYLAVHPSVF
jgi:hypothetical protein